MSTQTADTPAVPLTKLNGVLDRHAGRLKAHGIATIADVADADIEALEAAVGTGDSRATRIQTHARKLDPAYESPIYVVELSYAGVGR